MPTIERFVDALLANIVCLICVLPLVGALLTIVSEKMGVGDSRSTALTNAGLTLLLSLLMVANYNPTVGEKNQSGSDLQMISVFGWLAGVETSGEWTSRDASPATILESVEVKFAVGVDGISLWPIFLTSLLTFAAICSVSTSAPRQTGTFYTLLLTQQSLVFFLFASLDIVMFCVVLQLSIVPLFFLLGGWGGYDRVRFARHLTLMNVGGSLAVTIGLVSIAVLHANLSPPLNLTIPRLMRAFTTLVAIQGANDWRLIGPAVLLAIVGGFATRLPVFPWHSRFVSMRNQTSLPVGLLLKGLFPLIGLYGLARFAVPLLAASETEWTDLFRTAAIGGSIYCGLLGWLPNDRSRIADHVWLGSIHLAIAGIFTLTSMGFMGGLLYAMGMALSISSFELSHSNTRRHTACTLALMSIPGSAGFAGLILIVMALVDVSVPLAIGGLFGWGVATSALICHLCGRGDEGNPEANTLATDLSTPGDARRFNLQVVALTLLLIMITSIGLNPQFFTSRMERSVLRILKVTTIRSVAEQPSDKGDQADNKQDGRVKLDESGIPGNDKPDDSDNHHHQAGN